MTIRVWVHSFYTGNDFSMDMLDACLKHTGIVPSTLSTNEQKGSGIIVLDQVNLEICEFIHSFSVVKKQRVLIVALQSLPDNHTWQLLEAGASDVLMWPALRNPGAVIAARLNRWQEIDDLINSPLVRNKFVGQSKIWVSVLRRIVEAARFTDVPVLITGETGTGKELAAQLIHKLDEKRNKHELVILDCTTIVPELSGSELFGHERGAFTGAVAARDGAFALANDGSLFLDEIGELSLGLQIQLLRVLQEGTYKRVGSNTWHNSNFRLLCATNRDLLHENSEGRFRQDLYYRIAGWSIRLPPLRERLDDIIPLVQHFIRQAKPEGKLPQIDDRVKAYFFTRKYPGNVRDLQNLVFRMMANHVGVGPITVGDIPIDERPAEITVTESLGNLGTEQDVRKALSAGWGLRDIKQAIEETAIQVALKDAGGDLSQAAARLGVSVRTLQSRRAHYRNRDETIMTNGRIVQTKGIDDLTSVTRKTLPLIPTR
jgi:transcriptional regulator with GAF, ATPase, and Fis domain